MKMIVLSENTLAFVINNLPPMPRNRSHRVAGKMLIKTDLARAFEADLTKRLEKFHDVFRVFKGMVHLDEHYLHGVYRIYTPAGSLFTLDGRVSNRSTDWDAHKLFQDVVFKALELDDKLIRHGEVITPVSHDNNWNYVISLQLEPLWKLKNQNTPTSILNSVVSANLL